MATTPTNGPDTIRLGTGDDDVNALRGNDSVFGNAGNDTLRGDGGRDQLFGGADQDRLFGGDRADDLAGGGGADFLSGGSGGDRFDYDAIREVAGDTILDFDAAGGDRLDFSGIDAATGGGDDGFRTFLNPVTPPAPGGVGNAGFFDVGGDTVVLANNGDAQVRLVIENASASDVLGAFIA